MLAHVQVFCFLASYFVSCGLELSRLLGQRTWVRFATLGFGIAGFVAHTAYLFNRFRDTGLPPLLSSAHDWVLVLAWALVLLYLLFSIAQRDLALGVFTLPIVLGLILSTYFMTAPQDLKTEPERVQALVHAQRVGAMLHASSLVLGMVTVALGLVTAAMYLVKHRSLKTHHAEHKGWRMPSLERLALFNRWSVLIALLALTVGILTGIFLGLNAKSSEHAVRYDDPLVIAGGLVWLALTLLFAWQLTHRQQSGRQIAWLTVCACGILLLALVGLPAILGGSGFHGS